MKQKQVDMLKTLIKEMVSKEVAKQIKYVINEITNPPLPKKEELVAAKPAPTTKPEISIKDNPVLEKVLNETQGGIMGNDEYPTMGGKTYTSQDMNTLAAPRQMQVSDDTPDFLKKAMSGHSAKVVKAIETKHGTRAS